ncbi:hypothetical protein Ade02nite_97050 [Paractinoplanes deccanensis]|uniref:Uncharacterized protein n=1 Tax=Paractinoplanes deccanensis TaxID=113561 RepID=A0ABQ3YM35_9ACTN|nr:hypothetical protein Ade02nite_97050 [Actinoplanes deccanensis]
MLASSRPDLHEASRQAAAEGWAFVILDAFGRYLAQHLGIPTTEQRVDRSHHRRPCGDPAKLQRCITTPLAATNTRSEALAP